MSRQAFRPDRQGIGRCIAAWLRSQIDHLVMDGCDGGEIHRARSTEREAVRTALSRLGWIDSRTDLLGRSLLFSGDPDGYVRRLEQQETVTVDDVHRAATRWLARPAFEIHVLPLGDDL